MKLRLRSAAVLALLAPFAAAAAPVVVAPESVARGAMLRVTCSPDVETLSIWGAVTASNGEVAAENAGFLIDEGGVGGVWVILLGVPSTLEPGDYALDLSFFATDTSPGKSPDSRPHTTERKPLRVVQRSFAFEEISLDGDMSDLRTSEEPRKARESLELWNILRKTDIAAVHHLGTLSRPVELARETSHYGDRRRFLYADGSVEAAVHTGVDLAASRGAPVVASADGRVVLSTDRALTGLTVVLEHLPGVYTLYYHMDSLRVASGARVRAGEAIGSVGSTGLATGDHLHWELRVGGVPIDPTPFLTAPLVDKELVLGNIGA